MPNCLEHVDPTVQATIAKLEGLLPDSMLMRVQISLSEALTNLTIHASTKNKSAPVDIVLSRKDERLIVEVFDPAGAKPFNPLDHARELSEIDPMAEGGRGVAIILECTDTLKYGPSDERNRLYLGFDVREEDRGFEPQARKP